MFLKTFQKIKKKKNCVGIALFSHGRLQCWGKNGSGEVGIGDTTPKYVSESRFIEFSDNLGATFVAAGSEHFCAIFGNARTRCWGVNDKQQLGERTFDTKGSDNLGYSVRKCEFVTFAPSINTMPVIALALGLYTDRTEKMICLFILICPPFSKFIYIYICVCRGED
jgi:hypothetical protein